MPEANTPPLVTAIGATGTVFAGGGVVAAAFPEMPTLPRRDGGRWPPGQCGRPLGFTMRSVEPPVTAREPRLGGISTTGSDPARVSATAIVGRATAEVSMSATWDPGAAVGTITGE